MHGTATRRSEIKNECIQFSYGKGCYREIKEWDIQMKTSTCSELLTKRQCIEGVIESAGYLYNHGFSRIELTIQFPQGLKLDTVLEGLRLTPVTQRKDCELPGNA